MEYIMYLYLYIEGGQWQKKIFCEWKVMANNYILQMILIIWKLVLGLTLLPQTQQARVVGKGRYGRTRTQAIHILHI